ncbi:aminotransferase class I/II-fold pyridoxal phosphate-dependent enzyme [Microbacterium sp. gxy059]|uniref:aminotransferase class I/II-fold pyridoxal phosphate-dependent enzyme n=1 Tax=Microbacterium sp. gxy059 TaxID=2957199 RepID=UPI003D982C47
MTSARDTPRAVPAPSPAPRAEDPTAGAARAHVLEPFADPIPGLAEAVAAAPGADRAEEAARGIARAHRREPADVVWGDDAETLLAALLAGSPRGAGASGGAEAGDVVVGDSARDRFGAADGSGTGSSGGEPGAAGAGGELGARDEAGAGAASGPSAAGAASGTRGEDGARRASGMAERGEAAGGAALGDVAAIRFVGPAPDGGDDVEAILAAATPETRAVVVANPHRITGRPLARDAFDRLLAGVPEGVLIVVDETLADVVSTPRAAVASEMFGAAVALPENVAVLRALPIAAGPAPGAFLLAGPAVRDRLSVPDPSPAAPAALAHAYSDDGLDELDARVEWLKAERQRIERTLRDRMERAEIDGRPHIPIVHADGCFVWIPVGDRAQELRAHLLAEAGALTLAVPGRGVRVTVRDAATNDRIIDAITAWATR